MFAKLSCPMLHLKLNIIEFSTETSFIFYLNLILCNKYNSKRKWQKLFSSKNFITSKVSLTFKKYECECLNKHYRIFSRGIAIAYGMPS